MYNVLVGLWQGCSHFFSMQATYYVTKSRRSTDGGGGGASASESVLTCRARAEKSCWQGGGPIFFYVMRSTILRRDRRIEHPWLMV